MSTTYPKIKNMSPQLVVADLKRSLDFYAQVLGFEIDFLYEDFYAGIARNGCSIHLKLGAPVIEARVSTHENENLDLMFSVEDIDGFFEAIKSQQNVIVQPLREMPYGREFYITDPDGYILGFIEEK